MTLPCQSEYDTNHQLIKMIDRDSQEITYSYDSVGNRVLEMLPNNIKIENRYDQRMYLQESKTYHNDLLISHSVFEYDGIGNLKRETRETNQSSLKMLSETDDDPLPGSYYKSDKIYEYDELNQLKRAEFTITQSNKTDHIVYEYGFNIISARSYVSTIKVKIKGKRQI